MSADPKPNLTDMLPKSMIRDFITFTTYVENHEVLLTKSNRWLSRKDLYAINALMTEPEQEVMPYSDQNAYPLLNLFYYLSLASKLFQTVPRPNSKQSLLPTDRLALFNSLKPAEQYVSLLESFWVHVDWNLLLGENNASTLHLSVPMVFERLQQLTPGDTIDLQANEENVFYFLMWHGSQLAQYFRYFGFWEMTRDEEKTALYGKKLNYFIKTITPSPLFYALVPTLLQSRDLGDWNLAMQRGDDYWDEAFEDAFSEDEDENEDEDEDEWEWEDEAFAEALIPLFPPGELTQWLPPPITIFFNGTYEFKVAYGKNCWRCIRLSSHFTLYDLHEAIQKAFAFEDDHMYAFFMDGKKWSSNRAFYSPDAEETLVVTEARLGDLELSVGQKFIYLFDFGDEWEFAVTVKEIQPIDTHLEEPQVIASKGKSPEQYRD